MPPYLTAAWDLAVTYRWVLLLAAYQVALIFLPHPQQVERPWLRAALAVLTRFSVARLRNAPGTLHLPGARQPWWTPAQLERLLGQLLAGQVRGGAQKLPEVPPLPREAPGDGPGEPAPRPRAPQTIYWLQPAAALLLVLGLAGLSGCTLLTSPRKATAAALKGAKERAGKFKAWTATEEDSIAESSKTREEARARVDSFRRAVDYCAEEVIRPNLADLRQVAESLDAAPAAGPASLPSPYQPAGGTR